MKNLTTIKGQRAPLPSMIRSSANWLASKSRRRFNHSSDSLLLSLRSINQSKTRALTAFLLALTLMAGLMASESTEARRRYRRMELNDQLVEELNGMLRATNEMHSAFFEQDEQKIETALQKVVISIDKASKKTSLEDSQRTHLNKMLRAAKSGVEMTKNTAGEDRKKNLQKAMKQIVQIAQLYDLDRYKVFFCPKDRSVWLQKSWKAKNPIHPKLYAKCGKLVR